MAENNPSKLYDGIKSLQEKLDSIRGIVEDINADSKTLINDANAFGGIIAKIFKEQMAKYFIPQVQKVLEPIQGLSSGDRVPGSLKDLTIFLDSVPLAMIRQEPTVTELTAPVIPENADIATPANGGQVENPVDELPSNASYASGIENQQEVPVQESKGKPHYTNFREGLKKNVLNESKETTDPSTWDDSKVDYEWLEEEPHELRGTDNLDVYVYSTGNVFLYKGKYLAQQGPTGYIEVYHPIPKEVEDYWKEWGDWDYVEYSSYSGLSKEQESKMRKSSKDIEERDYLLDKERCCPLDRDELYTLQNLLNKYGYPEERPFKVVIDDIDWDTDGEEVDLPLEDELEIWATTPAEAEDKVADALSDKYGWCVKSVSCEALRERNLTRAERYNRDLDRIFRNFDKQNEQRAEFLRDHGVPEEEIKSLEDGTGLGGNALQDRIDAMGLQDEFYKKFYNKSMTEAKEPEGITKYIVVRGSKVESSLGEVANLESQEVAEFNTKEEAEVRAEELNKTVLPEEKELLGTEYSVEEKKVPVTNTVGSKFNPKKVVETPKKLK